MYGKFSKRCTVGNGTELEDKRQVAGRFLAENVSVKGQASTSQYVDSCIMLSAPEEAKGHGKLFMGNFFRLAML